MKPFFSCCCFFLLLSCGPSPIPFDAAHRALLEAYIASDKDTLYFESSSGEQDTCVVVQLDSSQIAGSVINVPSKCLVVTITHLPHDHWRVREIYQDSFSHQELLSIIRFPLSDLYDIHFSYRDFTSRWDSLEAPIQGTLLEQDFGIQEYWEITNQGNDSKDSLVGVEQLIWTRELGLTAYYKTDGSYYSLKQ